MNLIKSLFISTLLLFVTHAQILGEDEHPTIDEAIECMDKVSAYESTWAYLMGVIHSIAKAIEDAESNEVAERYIDNTYDLLD